MQRIIERINIATGSPTAPYTRMADGKHRANVGNYHLDNAYGGYALVRTTSEQGSIMRITDGYMPKRELYNMLFVFIRGIEIGSGK